MKHFLPILFKILQSVKYQIVCSVDEIPSLLLNEAPLPVFSLRLFYQLILYNYEEYATFLPKSGIIEGND